MTVKELKEKLNRLPDKEYGHLSVVVTLKDDSVGSVVNTELEGGIAGFDWETGLFLFDTKEPIERYKEERQKDKAKYKIIRRIGETTICRCPTCQVDIDELDRFCRNCGQKFHTK